MSKEAIMGRRPVSYFAAALATIALAAIFVTSVAQGQENCQTFNETGKAACDRFLQYWQQNGELAQQGFPLTNEFEEVSDLNGQPYTVQYFERAVFEYHPEIADARYKVLLSQLGTFQYRKKYPTGAPDQKANTSAGTVLFPETGKHVGGIFLKYWKEHGGLPQQGYPISEEFTEVSDLNGKPYLVQYFERAVFEYHPEEKAEFQVLLSQLGRFQFDKKYSSVDPSPPVSQEPPRIPLQAFKVLYDDPAKRPLILDARSLEAYKEGHIKGAISFPLFDAEQRVNELPKDRLIVAYCQ
jgi:hypothetical protein